MKIQNVQKTKILSELPTTYFLHLRVQRNQVIRILMTTFNYLELLTGLVYLSRCFKLIIISKAIISPLTV